MCPEGDVPVYDIDRIMYLIHWNRSPVEQQEGIAMARQVSCIKAFFQPCGQGSGKPVWENCAYIICERTDEELKPYITDMLLWLQDLNWPGAEQIQRRLIGFQDVELLSVELNRMVPALTLLDEDSWLEYLADLLENEQLKESLREDVAKILCSHRIFT